MARSSLVRILFCCLCALFLTAPAAAENEGLPELDRATQLKVTAESLEDLNGVIDHLETALEKGLDEENAEFAEQLLVASLLQRGSLFAGAMGNVPPQDPQRGLKIIQLRQFSLSDLQRAVELDDQLWDAHLLIGRLQMQALPVADAGAARRALTKVAEAEAAAPEQKAEALALRSAVQRDEQKQLEDLNGAVELQPGKPEYLRLRAQYYYGKQKFDEALADVERALKLEPEQAMLHELRGMVLLGLEKYDEALASFDRATELVPEAALPYQHRGELYRQKGDLEQAAEQLTKALELSPDNVATLLVRAGVYYELEQPEKALEDIERAIRVRPELLQPHLMRVEIYAATNRIDEAITHLEQLLQMAPGNTELLRRLGSFYLIANKPRKAIETLSKVIEQEPGDFAALRFRADARLNIGEHAEAIADFERAMAINPNDAGVLNNFAWVLATSPDDELRDGERALKLATQAAEITKHETPHVLSTLAAAYAETGDFENAKKWSQAAIDLARKAVESAESDEERKRRQAELEQLEKELASYEEGKPVRERQSAGDDEEVPQTDDKTATPAPATSPTGSSQL